MVPLVSVIALDVTATLNVSVIFHVPPMPLNVIGKFMVLPLQVIVLIPLVAPKVRADADAVRVMPVDRVKLP